MRVIWYGIALGSFAIFTLSFLLALGGTGGATLLALLVSGIAVTNIILSLREATRKEG